MNIPWESPIFIPSLVAIVGWIASHQLAAWRDRANKRREQRVNYLISTFRALSKASHHPKVYEIASEVEGAISDIQFLGNEKQIKAAKAFATEFASNGDSNLDPLLFALREELRADLGRKNFEGKIWTLKIQKK